MKSLLPTYSTMTIFFLNLHLVQLWGFWKKCSKSHCGHIALITTLTYGKFYMWSINALSYYFTAKCIFLLKWPQKRPQMRIMRKWEKVWLWQNPKLVKYVLNNMLSPTLVPSLITLIWKLIRWFIMQEFNMAELPMDITSVNGNDSWFHDDTVMVI